VQPARGEIDDKSPGDGRQTIAVVTMSMNAHFVEIRPRLLKRLQQEPSLAEAVVYLELSDPGLASDDEAVEFFLRQLSRAKQQHMRALLSADVDAIKAAAKKVFPKKIWPMLMAHYSSMTKEQLSREAAEKRKGLIETVRQMKSTLWSAAQEKAGSRPISDDDIGERLCIDKAWDGLDYLLCSAMDTGRSPLDLAILGGIEIGKDLGYGPARYLNATEVRAVSAALSKLTHDTLRYHYDVADMNEAEVYPGRWRDGPNSDRLAWLLQAFDEVRHFYQGAAERENATLKYLL
jgi:hypothetical protein